MTHAPAAEPLEAPDAEQAMAALRKRGMRISAARRLVIEAVYEAKTPVSAEQIAAGLGGRLPGSDLGSVYRNLETLEPSPVWFGTSTPDTGRACTRSPPVQAVSTSSANPAGGCSKRRPASSTGRES